MLAGRRAWRSLARIIVFVALALPVAALADQSGSLPWITVQRWRTADGLPDNTVTALAQTPDGYMWIGTYGGLVRFDGRSFVAFNRSSEPEMPADRIIAVEVGDDGAIWSATEEGNVFRYKDGHFTRIVLPTDQQRSGPRAIGCDAEHDVWLADREGLVTRLRDGHSFRIAALPGEPRGLIAMARDRSTRQLYVLGFGSVARITADGPQFLNSEDGTALHADMICSGREDGIWVVGTGVAKKLKSERWIGETRRLPFTAKVIVMGEASGGTLVFGTSGEGAYLLDKAGALRHFGSRNGLGDSWVRSLFVGADDSVWVGTNLGGVALIRSTGFQRIVPPQDWDMSAIKSVTPRSDGGIWAGTEGGGLYQYDGTAWKRFDTQAGLTNPFVWAVQEDLAGRVWTGTWGGGLFLFQHERFERVPGLEDKSASIASLLLAKDGSMWVGTTAGLWHVRRGGSVERFGAAHGLGNADVRSMSEGDDGTLWFGLSDGTLGSYRNGRIEMLGAPPSTSRDAISALLVDERGVLWVGTSNDGLFRYDKSRFVAFAHIPQMPQRAVTHIELLGQELWLTTSSGILKVSRAQLDRVAVDERAPVLVSVYRPSNSPATIPLAIGAQPAGCRTSDGVLWAAAVDGLLRLNRSYTEPSFTPNPIVEQTVIDGRTIARSTPMSLEVPPGAQRIEFHYTAPVFKNGDLLQFRYRLRGEDRQWLFAGEERSAVYQRVPPGDYVFELEAILGDRRGRVEVPVTIFPTFWQRRSVRIGGYILSALIIGGLAHMQTRLWQRRRDRELQRQQALDRERARIARDIHDDLGASLTRISLMAQSAQRALDHPTDAAHRLDQVYETARQLTHKMDEIVWAVSPRHDTLESVARYLVTFAQEHLAAAGIACRFDVPEMLPDKPVYAEARHHLFLAFQEAINNIVKHAGGNRAVVSIEPKQHDFIVTIEDDGIGITERKNAGTRVGHGLVNMRRRMADIGGECSIGRAPSGGTRVCLRIPYERKFQPTQLN